MFTYLLFSEHNGYVRYYMWVYSFFLSTQSYLTALFGYGFSKEMFSLIDNTFFASLMSRSVDSYWLVNLLRFGWPMVIFLSLLVVFAMRRNRKNTLRRKILKQHRHLLEAWLVVLVSFTLISFTVHFWSSTVSVYMIILAASMVKIKAKKEDSSKHPE